MNSAPNYDHLLVFPHLRVQNANAISSPLTHGFPAMSAFLGLMWALDRKAGAAGLDLAFSSVGVVCHDYQEQVQEGYVKSFRLTRNPVDKDGRTAAIVEEGRIHLDITLLFGVSSLRWREDPERADADLAQVADLLAEMRIAGGSLLPPPTPERRRYRPYRLDQTGPRGVPQDPFHKARLRLLPGFALVARDDLLLNKPSPTKDQTSGQTGEAISETNPGTAHALPERLEAWLSQCRFNWRYHREGDSEKGAWHHDREKGGWIVPLPVGYGALGPVQLPGTVARARDQEMPFCFVESLYSLGEWISPHRLNSAQELLWYGESHPGSENSPNSESKPDWSHYRCRNNYCPPTPDQTDGED